MNNDITSILRLNSWAGRIVLAFYGVGTTVVALLNLGGLIVPALGIVALGLLWGGLAVLGLPKGEPLGLRWTLLILGIVTATTALMSWNIADPGSPGFATWSLGAMTFLLFVLALRGRRALAWAGFGAVAVVSLAVALIVGQNLLGVVNDVARQSATLVIGTLFAMVLRRATRTISALQTSQLRLATTAASQSAAESEGAVQSARLDRDARPALYRIIDPTPFTHNDLSAFAALELSLRQGVQPKGFAGDALGEAVRHARLRGLTVSLFDDRGSDLSPSQTTRLEQALLPLLRDTTAGTVTARLSPIGSEDIATIVVAEDGLYRRVVVTSNEFGLARQL